MLELRHCVDQEENKLASLTYASLSADNAGIPQEGTHPDHDGEHGNWSWMMYWYKVKLYQYIAYCDILTYHG